MTYVQRGFPKIRHTQPPCASVFSFPSWSYKNEAWSWIILARLWVQIWNSHWLWCLVFGLVFGFQYSSNLGGWPLTRSWPRLQKGKQSKTGVFSGFTGIFPFKMQQANSNRSTNWSTIWCTANREKKHDLVHGKPENQARIGARFGARQTGKKSTNWSTIWCTEQDRIYRSLGETWDQSGFEMFWGYSSLKGKRGALNGAIFCVFSCKHVLKKHNF